MIQYEFYTRDSSGNRSKAIRDVISIDTIIRRNEPIKWTIKGSGLEECPLSESSDILIFRKNKVLLGGFLNKKKEKYDSSTRIYDWEVSGLSDLGKLAWRMVFPDSTDSTPDPDGVYSASGKLSTVLLNAIDLNAGKSARAVRRLNNLSISSQKAVGSNIDLESKFDEMLKLVQDNLEDTDITLRETWNVDTGEWDVLIANPVDVSDKVVFSVDNGSISEWERTISAPTANWLLVTGCKDENDKTMSCIVSDSDSVSKWGRIEAIVTRSDITRNEDTNETWNSVASRLENAAYEELEKATSQFGYKLTIAEVNRYSYPENFDINSIVSVVVGGDKFTAKVEEIKITYAKGIETIVPSVGTTQRGELQSVFSEIGVLKEQIKVLQKS